MNCYIGYVRHKEIVFKGLPISFSQQIPVHLHRYLKKGRSTGSGRPSASAEI